MDIQYKRKLKQSYMILEGEPKDVGFEEQMLRQNEIQALLSFYTVELNRRIQFWYDITGKRSLRDYMDQEGLNFENLNKILLYLCIAYDEICKFLISEEHLFISPDTIFVEEKGSGIYVFLCYCPFNEEDVAHQIQSVMEYFIERVDHGEEKITSLCYKLYEYALRPGFSIDQLRELTTAEKNEPESKNIEKAQMDSYGEQDFFDEDYDTDEYVKESLLERIKRLFTRKANEKIHHIKKKKEQLLPVREDFDDIIYDPEIEIFEPTTMLRSEPKKVAGRLIYEGQGDGRDYVIDKDVFHIGSRSDNNDAVINSSVVSRNHARIIREGKDYYIEDLNSTNGTYVNGHLLDYKERIKLDIEDQILFADVAYRIV